MGEQNYLESELLIFAPPEKSKVKIVVKAAFLAQDIPGIGCRFSFPEIVIAENIVEIPTNCNNILSVSVVEI